MDMGRIIANCLQERSLTLAAALVEPPHKISCDPTMLHSHGSFRQSAQRYPIIPVVTGGCHQCHPADNGSLIVLPAREHGRFFVEQLSSIVPSAY
jgi:hypothetical protein